MSGSFSENEPIEIANQPPQEVHDESLVNRFTSIRLDDEMTNLACSHNFSDAIKPMADTIGNPENHSCSNAIKPMAHHIASPENQNFSRIKMTAIDFEAESANENCPKSRNKFIHSTPSCTLSHVPDKSTNDLNNNNENDKWKKLQKQMQERIANEIRLENLIQTANDKIKALKADAKIQKEQLEFQSQSDGSSQFGDIPLQRGLDCTSVHQVQVENPVNRLKSITRNATQSRPNQIKLNSQVLKKGRTTAIQGTPTQTIHPSGKKTSQSEPNITGKDHKLYQTVIKEQNLQNLQHDNGFQLDQRETQTHQHESENPDFDYIDKCHKIHGMEVNSDSAAEISNENKCHKIDGNSCREHQKHEILPTDRINFCREDHGNLNADIVMKHTHEYHKVYGPSHHRSSNNQRDVEFQPSTQRNFAPRLNEISCQQFNGNSRVNETEFEDQLRKISFSLASKPESIPKWSSEQETIGFFLNGKLLMYIESIGLNRISLICLWLHHALEKVPTHKFKTVLNEARRGVNDTDYKWFLLKLSRLIHGKCKPFNYLAFTRIADENLTSFAHRLMIEFNSVSKQHYDEIKSTSQLVRDTFFHLSCFELTNIRQQINQAVNYLRIIDIDTEHKLNLITETVDSIITDTNEF